MRATDIEPGKEYLVHPGYHSSKRRIGGKARVERAATLEEVRAAVGRTRDSHKGWVLTVLGPIDLSWRGRHDAGDVITVRSTEIERLWTQEDEDRDATILANARRSNDLGQRLAKATGLEEETGCWRRESGPYFSTNGALSDRPTYVLTAEAVERILEALS